MKLPFFLENKLLLPEKPSPDGSGYPFEKRSGAKDKSGQQELASQNKRELKR